jgi:hypothetical protein
MSDIQVYLLTFNCARAPVQPHEFGPHIFDALPQDVSTPDILVLSLQEIAPIAYAFLGGSFLTPYFTAVREAVRLVAKDHIHIVTRNVGMTAIMVFARDSTNISSIETAGVGVGIHELGNKGAVGIRLVYSETQMTFVAAHLAPMEDGLLRRNEDWKNIVKGLVFTGEAKFTRGEQDEDVPLLQGHGEGDGGGGLGIYNLHSHLFVAGDLNYRVSDTKPTPTDSALFPQPTDNPSSPTHFMTLLKTDQLTHQLTHNRTLHNLIEPPITFPPTYKLPPPAQPSHWNWAPHRWPSWCDRILYLEFPRWWRRPPHQSKITINQYTALPQQSTSDHRPVALSLSVPAGAIPDPPPADTDNDNSEQDVLLNPPFAIEPNWRSRRAVARNKEIVIGIIMYLAWTWEGNAILLANVVGCVGGWLIIRAALAG